MKSKTLNNTAKKSKKKSKTKKKKYLVGVYYDGYTGKEKKIYADEPPSN
jgi:hypothetical protein